jgi:hypothetical protein
VKDALGIQCGVGNTPRFGPRWRPCPNAARHQILDPQDPTFSLYLCDEHWQSLQVYTAHLDKPFLTKQELDVKYWQGMGGHGQP